LLSAAHWLGSSTEINLSIRRAAPTLPADRPILQTVPDSPMSAADRTEPRRLGVLDVAAPFAFGATIIASRIPAIICDCELNVDESQLIAQVRRYQLDLLPWRSVNGDTGGPLNTWYLLLAHLLGMPLEYAWVHALSAATLAVTVILGFLTARRFFGPTGALFGGVAGTLWVSLHQVSDFVQYASELVPILLVMVALAFVGRSFRCDVLGSFILGLMPWAKLQVVPIGAAIGLWLVARTLWPDTRDAPAPGTRVLRAAALVLSAALPSIVMICSVALGGAWEDCRRAYFETNLSYAGEAHLVPFLRRALDCAVLSSTVAPWILALLLGAFIVPWRHGVRLRFAHWQGFGVLMVAVVSASIIAWARTRTEWAHYDFFLLPGLILATGAIMEPGNAGASGSGLSLALAVALFAAYALALARPAFGYGSLLLETSRRPQEADGLLAAIRALVPEYRTMAIWGWRPSVYVRGHLTPPTRQANCGFLFLDSPNRHFLRERYAEDLKRSLPDLVVDSGGMSFEKYWHGLHAVETSEVAPVIRDHYALLGSIDAKDGTAYVYGLKDH